MALYYLDPEREPRDCPCRVTGPHRRAAGDFSQTVNPWNVNAAGKPKTADEIRDALTEEVEAWHETPLYHARCEP